MNNIGKSRRSFIKKTIFITSFLLFETKLPIIADQITKDLPFDIIKLIHRGKNEYYKRNYKKSASIYKKLIKCDCHNIAYYNGLKKALFKLNSEEEFVDIMNEYLAKNPTNILFYNRLAKIYRELATGNENKKVIIENKNKIDLKKEAICLNEKSIQIDNRHKFLYFELYESLKINTNHTISKKSNIELYKFYDEWLTQKSSKQTISKRERENNRKYYFQEELDNYIYTKNKSKKKNDLFEINGLINSRCDDHMIIEKAIQLLKNYPEERNIIGCVKKYFLKNNKYTSYELFSEQICLNNKTTWHLLGLAKAYRLNKKYALAFDKYNEVRIKNENIAGKYIGALWCGLSDCAFNMNNIQDAKKYIIEGLNNYKGLSGINIAFYLQYAKCLVKEEQVDFAIQILENILNNKKAERQNDDPIWEFLTPSSDSKFFRLKQIYKIDNITGIEKLKIMMLLYNIFNSERMYDKRDEILSEISLIAPNHPILNIKAI